MVVKSATKKWLMDGGMPELEAHILANDRRPYADVLFADRNRGLSGDKINKALVTMNYEEILDCLINDRLYTNSYPNMTPELYVGLSENLQRVKQHWLQRQERRLEEGLEELIVLHHSQLEDWDIEYKPWKFNEWKFMNWDETPFQTK